MRTMRCLHQVTLFSTATEEVDHKVIILSSYF